MTTNTLAAIRERADELEALNWREEDFDAYRYLPQTHDDRAALLAIVDELTARAEAAEAALRPFAELLLRYADLVAWCKQAADALAAHDANGDSAGNGGA